MSKLAMVLMLGVFGVVGCATVPSATSAQADETAVRQTLQAYVDGREARDIAAVRAVLDESVDQLTSRGEWRRGIDAATAGMQRSATRNPGTRTLEVETVRFLTPEVALADARYIIAGAGGPDRTLWSSFTLVRDADRWKITSIRNQQPAE